MKTQLVPLGINGYIPTYGRETMSFLVLTDEQAILLDAGTGISRLMEEGLRKKLASYEHLDVLLSHYHLDHVIGLSYLPGVWERHVTVHAPGPPFVEATPDEALGRLLQPPLFPKALRDLPMEVKTMREESFELGKLRIRLRAQKHPGGSAGIRLDNRLAYLTDTQLDLAAEQFIQGVELLLHEVWLTDQEAQQDKAQLENHSLASGVADLALAADVPQLMPVHMHPRRTGDAIEKLAADMKRDGLDVIVPREGQAYWVG